MSQLTEVNAVAGHALCRLPAYLPVLCGACRPRPSSSRLAIQTITITTNATTTTTTMTRHPTSLLLLLLSLLALSTASTSPPPPQPPPPPPQTNKSPKSNPNLLQMHLLHKLNHHRTRPRLRQPPLPPAPLPPLPRVPKRKTRRLRLVRPVQPRLLPAEVQPPHLPRRRGQGREHAVLSAGQCEGSGDCLGVYCWDGGVVGVGGG